MWLGHLPLYRLLRMSETPKGKASKEKILSAAEEVFREKGFMASSVGDVLNKLKISSGALYHHFPNKKSILRGIAERATQSLAEQMEAWLNDENLSPRHKVQKFLKALEDRRHMRLAVEKIGLGLVREDRDMHELVVQMSLEQLAGQLAAFIDQGKEPGDFDVENSQAAAILLILLLSEVMHRAGRIGDMLPVKDFDAAVPAMVTRILGIKNSR